MKFIETLQKKYDFFPVNGIRPSYAKQRKAFDKLIFSCTQCLNIWCKLIFTT